MPVARSLLARLWRQVGRRGCCLLFLGLLDLVFAFSLFKPQPAAARSAIMHLVADIAPLWVWGTAWFATAIACLVCAWRVSDRVAFAMAIAIKVIWGLVYIGGWIVAGIDRAWLGGAVWLAFALFVGVIASWPEPADPTPAPIPTPEQ